MAPYAKVVLGLRVEWHQEVDAIFVNTKLLQATGQRSLDGRADSIPQDSTNSFTEMVRSSYCSKPGRSGRILPRFGKPHDVRVLEVLRHCGGGPSSPRSVHSVSKQQRNFRPAGPPRGIRSDSWRSCLPQGKARQVVMNDIPWNDYGGVQNVVGC